MPFVVTFRGKQIGRFWADIVVEGLILIEIKVAPHIEPRHVAQALNYLRISNLEVGLILNFGRAVSSSAWCSPTKKTHNSDGATVGQLEATSRARPDGRWIQCLRSGRHSEPAPPLHRVYEEQGDVHTFCASAPVNDRSVLG